MGCRDIDADILDIDHLEKEYAYQQEDTLMQRYFKSYQICTQEPKGDSL